MSENVAILDENPVRRVISNDRQRSFAGLVYSALLLITVVPASVALLSSGLWSPLVVILGTCIAAATGLILVRSVTGSSFSLAISVFWMWSFVFMGLAPMYQLAGSTFPWKGTYPESTVLTAQLIVIVGCAVFYGVAILVSRRKQVRSIRAIGLSALVPNSAPVRRLLLVLLWGYLGVALIFIALMGASLVQGKLAFQEQLAANSSIPGAGTLFFLSTAGAIVIPAVGIVCRKNGVILPIGLLIAVSVVAFVATNPFTGSRFLTGSFAIAIVGALLVNRSVLRLMPAGIAGVLITVFPSLDLLRGDGTGASQIVFSLPHDALVAFDFDAFEMLLREVSVAGYIPEGLPTVVDLFIAPFLRWIPFLSDGVAGDVSGRVVAELTGMNFTSVSMPLWGEAHLIGGFAGVVIAFALLGFVLGSIRPALPVLGSPTIGVTSLIVDAPIAALLIIVLRGSLYEVLGYLLFAVSIAVLVWLVSRIPQSRSNAMTGQQTSIRGEQPRTIAFYLPQFHSIPENDEWWGKGFTEWSNVGRAEPQYLGHDHPRRPAPGLGQYDLNDVQVMHNQANLAREHDVDAFCFYFYWFGGKRLLEKPLNSYLKSGPDFPFCISWANESWTRRWDGKDKESLISQEYSSNAAVEVFDAFLPLLRDPRYLRIDGAPVILVHRADHLPSEDQYAEVWRQRAEELGVGPIHLVASETHPGINPDAFHFDAVCEFPPVGSNTLNAAKLVPVRGLSKAFRGRLMSYPRLARSFTDRRPPKFVRYRGVAPGWDNTARRRDAATIYVGSSPLLYRNWLNHARAYEASVRGSNGLVFINAWNEWAEGAYLEPDETHGRAYLEATRLNDQTPLESTPQPAPGLISRGWSRSVSLAAAGTLLQYGRRLKSAVLGAGKEKGPIR